MAVGVVETGREGFFMDLALEDPRLALERADGAGAGADGARPAWRL